MGLWIEVRFTRRQKKGVWFEAIKLTDPHVRLPAGGEECVKQIHEDSGSIPKSLAANVDKHGRERHANCHASRSKEEQLASTDSVDNEPRDQATEVEPHLKSTKYQQSLMAAHSDRRLEDLRTEAGDDV